MFPLRKMLKVEDNAPIKGPRLLVMTYNLLFRANLNRNYCRQKTYFYEGRDEVLQSEIDSYKPDILCLQEVSRDTAFSFWKLKLEKLGYTARFCAHKSRNHGIAVAYKKDSFWELGTEVINYQNVAAGEMVEEVRTCHTALLVALGFNSKILEGCSKPSKQGLIIGTTHLPPFPKASYERTKQAGILLKCVQKFADRLSRNSDALSSFYTVIAGDFNSSPDDAAYVSLTSKPVKFDGHTRLALGQSIVRDPKDKSFSGVCYFTENSELGIHAASTIAKLEEFHNKIKSRAISLYSVGYHMVHKENTGTINNEPKYSFWGRGWQGLLDYIFVVCYWNGMDNLDIDDPRKCAQASGVKVVGLLEMPTSSDMRYIPQPQKGMYPSDHFCMMAEVELI